MFKNPFATLISLSALLLPLAFPGQAMAQRRMPGEPVRRNLPPDMYVVDFVDASSFGVSMNDMGDVIGTSYEDNGCGPFCMPPLDTVVWRGDQRIILPKLPTWGEIWVKAINNAGWIVGFAGDSFWTAHRAVVWKPAGASYQVIDLGVLPGTTSSEATGIDDQGRVVGWSTTTDFPPAGSPFAWTEAGGMLDLSAQGYPDDMPFAISPGGTVATVDRWYHLGDPTSVTSMAPPPPGFRLEAGSIAINDAGDQGRFLVTASGQPLDYLYRYDHAGIWNLLSTTGTGHSSSYSMGSINTMRDVTGTILGGGIVAYGRDGLAEWLAATLSPAYPGCSVSGAGRMDARGRILTHALIGLEARLVRLTPAWHCTGNCMRVANVALTADFIPDPSDPTQDHCAPDLSAHDEATATITVTDALGIPMANAKVFGRFMDEYWTNELAVGTTDGAGVVSFFHSGPCGVGAISFLVDDVIKPGFVLDKTTGILTTWAVPQ
ncbi:MAG: hypothetical protein U1E76_21405 [Planctomycetota bacterium]